VSEHDIGHADKTVVQQRGKYIRFERLHESCETGNVSKQRRDLPALTGGAF
jgi:hypothetical protein